jgi:methionine biosynthesis protein MetW
MATVVEPQLTTDFVPDVLGRRDYQIIGDIVAEGSRVLDLGCGEGELLAWLEAQRGCKARGVEISANKVQKAVSRGLAVYQSDLDEGLADYPDGTFDYVVLSQTLQETLKPRDVLHEMVRVGKHAIIAFPNFGHWSSRYSLLRTGRAPKTKHLPFEWYDTPNVHFVTIPDFEELLRRDRLVVEKSYFLRGDRRVTWRPSLMADSAVYLITK